MVTRSVPGQIPCLCVCIRDSSATPPPDRDYDVQKDIACERLSDEMKAGIQATWEFQPETPISSIVVELFDCPGE
jgi:hypothetical protein